LVIYQKANQAPRGGLKLSLAQRLLQTFFHFIYSIQLCLSTQLIHGTSFQ